MNKIVKLKDENDIRRIRDCGIIISSLFDSIKKMDLIGLSTWELDSFIDDYILKKKARAAFKTVRGYSYASCISINEVASHGVPSKKVFIKNGDIVKIDTGTVLNGYFADSCITICVGDVSPIGEKLAEIAYKALFVGINEIYPGKTIGDIGYAIENFVKKEGFSVVRNFTGHGVGFALHEPPVVPNYGNRGTGEEIRDGMVMAVEPIVTNGSGELKILEDGWTSVTCDGAMAAQFEHTIAVTKKGPVILTA
ncbi:MAG: Methionine aminopeptidase 1 [Spirochaetes bacterium ADurb.Bin218]|jgi:methionyl aminopeptidase|nr:type I methionyl aminopeptidase [Spirochaetota bacterium]OQA94775.1 MAG: Methionine aminopeptidase 1 [Spirochaetes bacterium ADurb.Bin218]HPX89894.1 type I methionyl aminopeptidase [Spirochaetota bacterium]